ncbi:LPXTG cell wall anchor domain-containing protein [Enterococcus sp. AZ007]|uniref:LPXTG cell wall anchor domain-containing protein n=2 Tax=Candidatus Enterococcus murrayae TaxID=2815321 RepID=A0ABS3HKB0_9ENTE|nr:LPXTG cell wall anchor domain-containing protein [Enterococcus sp. MJM16]
MKKVIFLLLGLVSSVLLLINPVNSNADSSSGYSTPLTITFSNQVATEDNSIELPLIKKIEKRNDYDASYAAASDKRLPMTGEEYNSTLLYLGMIIVLLFFFISIYERMRNNVSE